MSGNVMNEWALQGLVDAYHRVQAAEIDYDTAKAMLEDVATIRSWLSAERGYTASVERWLLAEKRWETVNRLLQDDTPYAAAKRGWIAMRVLRPNLDGVNRFEQLPPLVMDRYALFAAAVLGRDDFELEP